MGTHPFDIGTRGIDDQYLWEDWKDYSWRETERRM